MATIWKVLLILLMLLILPLKVYCGNCLSVDGNPHNIGTRRITAVPQSTVYVNCERGGGTNPDWHMLVPADGYSTRHVTDIFGRLNEDGRVLMDTFGVNLTFNDLETRDNGMIEFRLQIGKFNETMNNSVVICGATNESDYTSSQASDVTVLVVEPEFPTTEIPTTDNNSTATSLLSCQSLTATVAFFSALAGIILGLVAALLIRCCWKWHAKRTKIAGQS